MSKRRRERVPRVESGTGRFNGPSPGAEDDILDLGMATHKEMRIKRAAEDGKTVSFDYKREGDGLVVWERRVIEPDPESPIRENADGRKYLIGRDVARDGPRSFHTDKIDRLEVSP